MDSSELQWTPVNSSELQWTPVDSSGLHWNLLVYVQHCQNVVDSGGLRWTPVDSGDTFVSPLSFLWVYHRSPVESSDIRGGVVKYWYLQRTWFLHENVYGLLRRQPPKQKGLFWVITDYTFFASRAWGGGMRSTALRTVQPEQRWLDHCWQVGIKLFR